MRRHYLSYLKSILIREPSFIIKYYICRGCCNNAVFDYVYMADGKMEHGGLFDRLKGAVSIYALSQVHKKKFGLNFKSPFSLEKYLLPNQYDWRIKKNNIFYKYPFSRPIIAYSEYTNPKRLLKRRKGQTHYYYGDNILPFINQTYGCNYEWTSLFNELFSPSPYLLGHINSIKKDIEGKYLAIHLRFLNLLGDKNENDNYQELSDTEKQLLIKQCIEKVKNLQMSFCKDYLIKVLVCSDSPVFNNEVKKAIAEILYIEGNAKHIDRNEYYSDDDILKLFTDIYMIAGAVKVYSIVGNGLYPSAFPKYSAMIGGKPFERIKL